MKAFTIMCDDSGTTFSIARPFAIVVAADYDEAAKLATESGYHIPGENDSKRFADYFLEELPLIKSNI